MDKGDRPLDKMRMRDTLAKIARQQTKTRSGSPPGAPANSAGTRRAAERGEALAKTRPPEPPATAPPRGDRPASVTVAARGTGKAPAPPRAGGETRAARPAAPLPDTLDSDRILELPAHRTRARTAPPQPDILPPAAPARQSKQHEVRSPLPLDAARRTAARQGGMQSLGDALQGYVAVLDERRKQRGAAPSSAQRPMPSTQDEVCPICNGAGWRRPDVPFGDPRFGQPVPCVCKEREIEERHRREEEERLRQLDRFVSLRLFAGKTFDTFDARTPGLREAYKAACDYAAWLRRTRQDKEPNPSGGPTWLLLMGSYGTGKTHLAAAIAHEALATGLSVYFAIVPELLDHLRSAFAPSSELSYDEMFDKICEVELLVLDDLGAENGTAWATEKLFQLINYRYNSRMPTVVTTNNQLHARMDERVRSRLADLSLVQPVAIKAQDYRPRNTRGAARG